MSGLLIEATIKGRRDTAGNWTSNNPTLNAGEIGIETDTLKEKRGDGSTAWTSLAYSSPDKITGSTDQISKAWCTFDGTATGTNAPAADYNVTTVTRNSIGDYTVTFTSNMSDTNYAVIVCAEDTAPFICNYNTKAVGSVVAKIYAQNGTIPVADPANVSVHIFAI
jgi:hypothetical protein